MIAAHSNGGGYANQFQNHETDAGNPAILQSVLAELWDFDTRISTDKNGNPAKQDYLQQSPSLAPLKTIRGYYQTDPSPDCYFNAQLRDENDRWKNYYSHALDAGRESPVVPSLPPGPYNDTGTTDTSDPVNGRSQMYRHHLIREFMFKDAAANNNVTDIPRGPDQPPSRAYPYHLVRNQDWVLDPVKDKNVPSYTNGPGHYQSTRYLLDDNIDPSDGNAELKFSPREVNFTALLYGLHERQDDGSDPVAAVAPNWFGVAVPDGITDYRNVIIYFHPYPGQKGAGYLPGDYQDKSGDGVTGTNWKELYAYVERLGKQLAASGNNNQILIFPFMENYDDVGIFPQYWYCIVMDILDDIYLNGV